ncbi:hypothetical protein EFY79_06915 [Hanamia caeni]|jgi:hypothetical protein|uniref:Uncharacterized protein n=1 Tax=Hanamia caeni TaxID=2294116 RepID=A0A3M9NLU2_9BACT|nr:hypothetical protein [Hanamia caeni]RNI37958.1 hypothetical protein EFY79_06915 [Hanamia caeni]
MHINPRPPTKRMIEKLKECLEKETVYGEKIPCLPEEMKSSLAGLYKRGLIGTRMDVVNEKKVLCIFVTDSGKQFVADLEKKVLKKEEKSKTS